MLAVDRVMQSHGERQTHTTAAALSDRSRVYRLLEGGAVVVDVQHVNGDGGWALHLLLAR